MPAPSSALAHSSSHRRRRAKHTAYCLWVPMPCAERIDVLDVEGGVEEQPRSLTVEWRRFRYSCFLAVEYEVVNFCLLPSSAGKQRSSGDVVLAALSMSLLFVLSGCGLH
ncbi:hypothetical protein PC9H_008882 [Pleurotus ostreatus]|uniref:Uncharacterized protein n=2 Tax=Pleurotus ostreatus TaxID=5322 RepID=A0A067NZ26_PLEO1|nr:uncharacterized protein PC9H_008882 [Pleurotus ostreatus]KAF7426513.1 hypothetical protein PC9H_008882 [Pleurotus ostreatus]KDQ32250.1 hypothetical protein PLEOSDRAFT_165517 [Pleurotus ostreatus PC15]